MNRKAKRILSWLLTVAMILGGLSFQSPGWVLMAKADREAESMQMDSLTAPISRAVSGAEAAVVMEKATTEDDGWTVTWGEEDVADPVPNGTTYGNYTVSSVKSKVSSNSKELNGKKFTHRFQFNGKDKDISIFFEAPTKGTLTVYGITGSSSALDRCLTLEGDNGYKETTPAFPNVLTEYTFTFEEGGTYYLYSTVGAVNIYYLSYEMGLDGTAPVIKESSVKAELPADGSSMAEISWAIETEAVGNAKVQVEYRIGSGDWQIADVLDGSATSYSHDILSVESGQLQYRITGLGQVNSTPVESNTIEWEQPRKEWVTVDAPTVTAAQGTEKDIDKIVATWNMEMGRNGADQITIVLKDKEGKVLDTKELSSIDVEDAGTGEVLFVPETSGEYSIVITAERKGENEKKTGETTVSYSLPLATPSMSVSCKGKGIAEVSWKAVPEADTYEVFVKAFDADDSTYVSAGETTEISKQITGLTDGEKYTFKVTANRVSTGDVTEATVDKYMTGLDEKEFHSAPVGSGAKGTAVGDFYEKDGKVTIKATGGKIADSEDGFVFYYTELGVDDNFTLDATFTITAVNTGGTMSNQTGFGLIAIDTIAGAGNGNGRYFNSSGAMTAKFRKMNPETGSASSFDNLSGLRSVAGYTNPDANVGESTRVLHNTDTAFEYPDSNSATHTYEVGDTYHFILRRSNTGYHGSLVKEDGTVIEKIFYYPEGETYTDPLLVQDAEHIYVGLMASRYIEVEVSNMSLTTIKPEDDEDRVMPPVTYTVPNIAIYSTTTIGTAEYPFEYRANIGGTLVVTDGSGKELINKEIQAEEYVEEIFTLTKGKNTFTCTLTPSEEEKLESFDPIVKDLTVSYESYGKANETIIVTPDGKSSGTGSESKPLDIYTAFKYVQPGQTILLKNGTYKLTEGLNVKRGHDGTSAGRITVVAETPGEVILDLSNTSGGISIGADYWHLYGLNICNAPFGVKVVYIQGNHNIVELCKMYDNGDSGLQISGSSQEPNTKWPSYNIIKNCDAYDNADYKANDADGFAAKLTSGVGNIFEGCISHHNIDDGWDLYAKSTTGSIGDVIIRNCVTYANGFLSENARLKGQLLGKDEGEGNGFKLGGESMPGRHLLINSISFGNGAKGVTSNSGPDCRVQYVTSYGNATFGGAESISLYTNTASSTNYEADGIISMSPVSGKVDKLDVKKQDPLYSETNYFFDGTKSVNISGEEATEDWFVSVDTTILPTRNEDGSINMHGLLELTDAAPSNAGGRLEAVVSTYPEVPAAIKDKIIIDDNNNNDNNNDNNHNNYQDDDSDDDDSDSSSSSTVSTKPDKKPDVVDLGDTTGTWKQDEKGWWYQKADSTYPSDSWLKVSGEWYLFGADGYLKTGWQKTEDGKWYYLDNANGNMRTGWMQTDEKWYFLDLVNGDMRTGWMQTEDGTWYFFDQVSGEMKIGWIQTIDGKWYYLNPDGSCAMDTVTPDGYRVDENGVWVQ